MILIQKDPILFAPQVFFEPVVVQDASPSSSPVLVETMSFNETTSAASHWSYNVTGINLTNIELVDETPPGSIDMTQFPLIQRASGVNTTVWAKFSNGRGTTVKKAIVFSNQGSLVGRQGPTSLVSGSYAEYSWNQVRAIFDNLAGPDMFTSAKDRAFPSVIPHAQLTGHMFNGGWGVAGGRRFSLVTNQVMVGVAHYGFSIGEEVSFKDASNVEHKRTILGRWSANEIELVGSPAIAQVDFSMYLLSSPLPSSIKPFPIAGPWISRFNEGSTSDNFTSCPQFFGVVLTNNDGHIVPAQVVARSRSATTWGNLGYGDFELTAKDSLTGYAPADVTLAGFESWGFRVPSGKFFHYFRGGDSGCPFLAAYADGWCLAGIISGGMWKESAMNHVIGLFADEFNLDLDLVTVAPDPTA